MLLEKGQIVISGKAERFYRGVITLVIGSPEQDQQSYIMVKWEHLSYPTQHRYSYFIDNPYNKVAKTEQEALGIILKLK
jgi:hypothetical protein